MSKACEADKTEKLMALLKVSEELFKDPPEEKKLREVMKQAGLKYKENAIDRIQMVLDEIYFIENEE